MLRGKVLAQMVESTLLCEGLGL